MGLFLKSKKSISYLLKVHTCSGKTLQIEFNGTKAKAQKQAEGYLHDGAWAHLADKTLILYSPHQIENIELIPRP